MLGQSRQPLGWSQYAFRKRRSELGGDPRVSALETQIMEGHFLRVINVLSEASQRLLFAGVSKFGLVLDSFPFGVQEQAP